MSLIALELNDAGIIAAAGTPARLLKLDGQATESPGFALPQKDGLLVGKEAEGKAHLFPRQTLNRFWDQLNTEPLEQPAKYAPQSHAEIVYHHMAHIWQAIQKQGDEVVLVVPDFYGRQQLGLILGIAQELSMDVKGFVPMALAASLVACPGQLLMHLDIHLHRIEVNYLKQGEEHLTIEDSAITAGKGLIHLQRDWVETIAQEFVGSTRFDPLHLAASEQELYDRLPGVLSHLHHNSAMVFDMIDAGTAYSITLKPDLFAHKAQTIYEDVCRLIEGLRNKHGKQEPMLALQLSHRISRLPGFREILSTIEDTQIIELERGAAANGVLEIWRQFSDQPNTEGISFFTSRPWRQSRPKLGVEPSVETADMLPTHLLHRSVAYPITDKPLSIGTEGDSKTTCVQTAARASRISSRYCTIGLRDREVVLDEHSSDGIFVDGTRVRGSMVLRLGQIIHLGTNGEQFQLIACLSRDET
ncbi:MAG: FHA domain-containing protein [Desulfobacterales bacterium]|jgi:hypothetical protein